MNSKDEEKVPAHLAAVLLALEVLVLVVAEPVVGVPLLEGVAVHRVSRDVAVQDRLLLNLQGICHVIGLSQIKTFSSSIVISCLETSHVRCLVGRARNDLCKDFTITVKNPTRTFSCLEVPTSAFTFI